MAFTNLYCNASTGSNVNAGDLTANGVVTSTNGSWSTVTNLFIATGGTPFSGVSVGDFCALRADGATVAAYIARVTNVGGGGLTLTLSATAVAGAVPTTAATGISATTGGAWQGPNAAVSFPFNVVGKGLTDASGNTTRINLKNGTNYAITSTITFSTNGPFVVSGYTSTPGDDGMFVVDGGTSGASFVLMNMSGASVILENGIFQNNGSTGVAGGFTYNTPRGLLRNVVVHDVKGTGITNTSSGALISCEVYNCGGTSGISASTPSTMIRCNSHDNTGAGFIYTGGGTMVDCVADSNGAQGISLPSGFNSTLSILNSVFYNNVSDGIAFATVASQADVYVENSIFSINGGYGINQTSTSGILRAVNNAFNSNSLGQTTGINASLVTGSITLSGDPFTAAATGNFILNNTAGAGASCRGAGIGAFTETQASYTGTVGYPDVGAAQHLEVATGGGGFF